VLEEVVLEVEVALALGGLGVDDWLRCLGGGGGVVFFRGGRRERAAAAGERGLAVEAWRKGARAAEAKAAAAAAAGDAAEAHRAAGVGFGSDRREARREMKGLGVERALFFASSCSRPLLSTRQGRRWV
jgi:hypothetical protein